MLNRSLSSAGLAAADNLPHGETDEQTLWHVSRTGSPSVTAVLVRLPTGVELQVTYGTLARQCVACPSSLAAAARAERLFCQLEERGYRRARLGNRPGELRR